MKDFNSNKALYEMDLLDNIINSSTSCASTLQNGVAQIKDWIKDDIKIVASKSASVNSNTNHSEKTFDRPHEWSYKGENGPEHWHQCYPVAASDYQSPINIEHRRLVFDPKLKDVVFKGYDKSNAEQKLKILNDGFSIKLNLENELTLQIKDSPSIYKAFQMTFHWGSINEKGSEHLIDGQAYPMEVQIIHRNTKYTVDEMYDKQDGLLILAFFVEVTGEINESYKVITESLHDVTFQEQETVIESFPLQSLMPEDTSTYFFYVGSLTIPPCNECASWIILSNTVQISQEQINQFRRLCTSKDDTTLKLVDNFRPPQKICRRVIKACFKLQDQIPGSHIDSDDENYPY